MKTNYSIASLLVAASMALAAPALGQSRSAKELPALRALERLDGQRSPDLRELRALRDLKGPRQVARHARNAGPEQTERFSKTFRVGRTGSLDLTNISGDITVKAGGGDEIVIDALKRTPQGDDAQRNLQAVTIEAVENGGRVEVRTKYPERSNNIRTSVDFTVTVPAGAAVSVHSISGDIEAAGTKGALRLATVNGDVKVNDAGQIEEVKSISGDITVAGGSGTDVRTSTVSGDVTLRNVKVRALDASSISGDTTLDDVTADRAAVKTMNGNIAYTGPFAKGGRYEFKAHSGDVRIVPTSNAGFEISADTFNGGIKCDLPINARTGELPQHQMRRELKGTVGDGGATVTVTTFSGDVTITRK